MELHTYYKYYRVNLYDTTVLPVSVNDFRHLRMPRHTATYQLLPEDKRFTGYISLITALEKAKAGALAYLEQLEAAGKQQEIVSYRITHYEDLNINLVDSNIRKIEYQLAANPNLQWHPYRINF